MPKTKAITKSTRHKVGQYLVASDCVYLKVVAVVDSGMGPMYALLNPKSNHLHWESQYQVDNDNMTAGVPEFDKFKALQAGDILKLSNGESDKNTSYVTVLARVDDAVLLSARPNRQLAQRLLQLDKMFSDISEETGLSFSDLIGEEDMAKMKKLGSSLHAAKIAEEWLPIETITLMNWEIVTE